ncbi:MAG: CPBP family intramembrane glutamic endopeptidase [Nitrososphaerota archaeon]
MPTLADYMAVFIEMLPLFAVMVLVPGLIRVLVFDYTERKCYLDGGRPDTLHRLKQTHFFSSQIHKDYMYAVYGILVAPFAEEILFRGIPLLIDPTGVLAWIGTVGWSLAHPIHEVSLLDNCKHAKKTAVINILTASAVCLLAGVFYMLVWLRGFAYGTVAIAYHSLYNIIVLVSSKTYERRQKKKLEKAVEEYRKSRRRVEEPVAPATTLARRILKHVGLETSIVAGSPEEAEKLGQTISKASLRSRRVLRET